MAKLYFKVGSDWEEVVRLRNEIEKLKSTLKGMDGMQSPAAFKALNTQLSTSTQRMDELVNEAAKAGAMMEGSFKKKIFDASQSVNGFTEKIIAQKNAIGSLQTTIRKNKELYKNIVSRGNEDKELLNYIREQEKALGKERDVLFSLTQQQANARLSVKKLRDEYALYQNDGKQVVETNNGIAISWKKALAVIGGAAALKHLVSEILRVRGEFQSMQTTMETMVGKDVAGPLMAQVKELAKISPLTMTDMVGAEKMMLGFNIQAGDTIKYLKALSDISMGESGKFNSLTLAFSQMSAAGKLMGQDLNQMINAGFNPLQQLSEKTGKSMAVLKEEMSKGAISAEMVQQAFLDATAAGGKFYNMSENASKTINGQISMMQDALDNVFNELGTKGESVIMSGIQMTTSLIENYETVGKVLTGLMVTYGAYRTAVMLVTAAESKHTLVEIGLTNARVLARKAQLALNAAMLTNPYVLLAVAVGGLVTAMWAMSDSTTAAARAQKEYNDIKDAASKKEQEHKQKIEELLTAARDESLATLTRQKSLEELRKEYPKIFEKYDVEKLKLEDILKLKQQINEEDSKRSVQGRKDDYNALKQTVANQRRYLQLFDNPDLRKNMSDFDKDIWKMFSGKQSYVQVREQMEKNSELLKKYQKDVLDDNISAYKANLKNYSKEKLEAELKLAQSSASKRNGFVVNGMMVKGGDLESVVSSINSALSEKKASTTYKQDYEKAKEDWEDAKKILSEIEKDKSKFTSKQYEEAKKRKETTEKTYKDLGGVVGSGLVKEEKQAEKLREQQEKYNLLLDKQQLDRIRRSENLENQLAQSKIDAMSDGFEKEQTQREFNNRKEIKALQRQKEDFIRAYIQAQKDLFDAEEDLKAKQTKGYVKKSFDSASVSVDTSSFDAIIDNTSKRQQNDKLREQEDSWDEYLIKYGTFQGKKAALTRKYEKLIAGESDAGKAALLQKEFEDALSALDVDKLKQDINWELVFGDLSKVSKKELDKVNIQLKNFRKSSEYQNMTVEQKKVIDEALDNMQSAIIDKGGILGDLPDQLDNLRKAQDELQRAQDEYNKSLENGTLAEQENAKKKQNFAEQNLSNAAVNVEKSKNKAINNITAITNAISQLGNAEVSLSDFGSVVGTLVDVLSQSGTKIGGLIASVLSLLDVVGEKGTLNFAEDLVSNIFESLRKALAKDTQQIVKLHTFGLLDIDLMGPDGTAYYEGIKEQLEAINKVYEKIIANSKEGIQFGEGFAAIESASTALDNYNKKVENLQKIADASGRAGASWNHHSAEWHSNKNVGVENFSQMGGIIDKSIQSMDDLYYLSGDELYLLMTQMPEAWSAIDGRIRENLENIINCKDEANELKDALNQAMTGIDQDSFYNGFIDQLSDMDTSFEDMCDNFEGYLRKSIISGLIASQYKARIDGLYEQWSEAAKSDKEITEDESGILQQTYKEIIEDMMKDREQMAKGFGWDSSSSSQSSTSKGFQAMSQDTGEELNGRFTALQIAGEEIKNQNNIQSQSLNLLTAKADAILSVNTETRNIADDTRDLIAQSYLELVQISENTGAIVKPIIQMQKDMAEVKKNTSKL